MGKVAPGSDGIGAWSGADGPRVDPLPAEPLASMLAVPCWPNGAWSWLRDVGSIPERPAKADGLLAWCDGPATGACMG